MLAVGRPRRCGAGPFAGSIRPGNGPLSTLRKSRDASGPALLFIQAEIGAVVRGVKAGEFDYPT
jgi:hypothetical protein